MASPHLDELGERLGIVLRDQEAIRQAFVHSSFFNENPGALPGHNERLEFLGDAVIGQVVSRLLYDRYRRLLPLIAAHWGIDAMVNVGAMLGLPL